MLLLLPQRVALIVTTNPPPPNKAWAIRVEWRRAISAQLAGKQGGTYIFWPRCFADCESCTRPISTNSGSMEAGECGLTRGTCFVARRHEVVAVALLLWISWCFGCGGIFSGVFSFFFLRTHTACYKYEAALPHLPLLVMRQGRGNEATEAVFYL